MASEEGENDWVFDIIITFLRSPRWRPPKPQNPK